MEKLTVPERLWSWHDKDHQIRFTFPSTVIFGVFSWSIFGCDLGKSPFPSGFGVLADDQHCLDLNVFNIIQLTSCLVRFEARVFILAWALHCSRPNQNSSTKSYQEQKQWIQLKMKMMTVPDFWSVGNSKDLSLSHLMPELSIFFRN